MKIQTRGLWVLGFATTLGASLFLGGCTADVGSEGAAASDDAVRASGRRALSGEACGPVGRDGAGRTINRACVAGLDCLSLPSLDTADQGQMVWRCVTPRAPSDEGGACGDWYDEETGDLTHADCAKGLACAAAGNVRAATCVQPETSDVGERCGIWTDPQTGERIVARCASSLYCAGVTFSNDGSSGTCEANSVR